MDSGTTIMGIVILFICVTPIILSTVHNSRKKKKILQGLFDFAEKNNCKISQNGMSNSLTIGIDDTANMVFFRNETKDNEILQQINLSEVQQCRVVNSTRTVKNKNSNYSVVEKLELAFTNQDKNKKEIVLEFYNQFNDGLTVDGEVQFVEKWCNIINNKISSISKQK